MLLRVLQGDMRFLKDLRYSAVIFGFRKISITSENEINKCSILKKMASCWSYKILNMCGD